MSYLWKHIIGAVAPLVALMALAVNPASAQVESVLYNTTSQQTNTVPQGLTQDSNGNWWGTTSNGGTAGLGTIFKFTPPSTYVVMHNFGDGTVSNDGAAPYGGLLLGPRGLLYGTTSQGGTGHHTGGGDGTIFSIDPNSGAYNIVYPFGGAGIPNDGYAPYAPLAQDSQGNIYGTTTAAAGISRSGTVFELNPATPSYTILHRFGLTPQDGTAVYSGVCVDSNGNLFGGTSAGGTTNGGILYEISSTGTYTILHTFVDGTVPFDGFNLVGTLVTDGNGNFYGQTLTGGANFLGGPYPGTNGVVFTFTAAPGSYQIIHNFNASSATNAATGSGLVMGPDGNLYGTTSSGPNPHNQGTLYRLTPTGQFALLYVFGTVPGDVTLPWTPAFGSDGNIYGLAQAGGQNGFGGLWEWNFTGAPAAKTLVVSPPALIGGQSASATATLTAAAVPSISPWGTFVGGQLVKLASNDPAATMPTATDPDGSSVITGQDGNTYLLLPTGSTSGTFTIDTTKVTSRHTASISGTLGSTVSANLSIVPSQGLTIGMSPANVFTGTSSTGTVSLFLPAGAQNAPWGGPVAGNLIQLTTNNAAATLPAGGPYADGSSVFVGPDSNTYLLIPTGNMSGTFTVATDFVPINTAVTIDGVLGMFKGSKDLTIDAEQIIKVTISPNRIYGSDSGTGTVTLKYPAYKWDPSARSSRGPAFSLGPTTTPSSRSPRPHRPYSIQTARNSSGLSWALRPGPRQAPSHSTPVLCRRRRSLRLPARSWVPEQTVRRRPR